MGIVTQGIGTSPATRGFGVGYENALFLADWGILERLFPIDLGDDWRKDLQLEETEIEKAEISAQELLEEIFPDTTNLLIADWERVCGITPGETDTLAGRRSRVIQQLQSQGSLSRAHFIALAAILGFTIIITENIPFMAGWAKAKNELFFPEITWVWNVDVQSNDTVVEEAMLEEVIAQLKPAHTEVYFTYQY